MLLFTATTLTLLTISTVQAATFNVDIGSDGNMFTPSTVTAESGDTIIFTLYVGEFYPILSYPILSHPDLTLFVARVETTL